MVLIMLVVCVKSHRFDVLLLKKEAKRKNKYFFEWISSFYSLNNYWKHFFLQEFSFFIIITLKY